MRQKQKTRDRLIEGLLTTPTITEAAERAGCSRQHAHRLLRDADFTRALRAARSQAFSHAMSRLCHLSTRAVSVLESALTGGDVSKTRFLSARAILQLARDAVADDFAARLEEIERELERLNEAVE